MKKHIFAHVTCHIQYRDIVMTYWDRDVIEYVMGGDKYRLRFNCITIYDTLI